jgi:hypothetical protein
MDRLNKTPKGKAMKARYKKNKQAKVKAKYHNARKPNRHNDGRRYYREYDATRRENSYDHGDECVFLTEQDLIAATAAHGEDNY